MKPHTLFLTLGILLLGFSACEPLNETPETPAFSLNLTSPDGEPSTDNDNAVLQKLVYHLFIFRSNTANPSPDNDGSNYTFWRHTGDLTLKQIREYTLSIPSESTDRSYLLLVHATPKEKPESEIISKEGMTFSESEISMIKENDNNYVPLSKDNYYAIQQLTPEDIAQGKTSIEFKLKRAVGELVFDVMKCDEKSHNPIDIDTECSSTLDRVFRIDIAVNGVIPKVSLTNETRNPERINICFSKEIVLKSDYTPDFANNTGVIEPLTNAPLDTNEKAVKGAKDDYVHITPQLFDDISKVVKNIDTIRDDYWNDGVSELNRLKRMGIENNAELCKGSTTDSDSVCLGSNPSSAAITGHQF